MLVVDAEGDDVGGLQLCGHGLLAVLEGEGEADAQHGEGKEQAVERWGFFGEIIA